MHEQEEKHSYKQSIDSALEQPRGRLFSHLRDLYQNTLDDETFDDVWKHYALTTQLDNSNANSHYNLANFLLELGEKHLLRALEINPDHTDAITRYSNLIPVNSLL